jgi:hypothetical protein
MRLIIHLGILCDAPRNKHVYTTVSKEYETDLVPMVGMEIEDPAWKKSRRIKSVTINPSEGYYYVYTGDDKDKDDARCEQLKQMYLSHGWTSP